MSLTVGSLFAGVEGFGQGLEAAGFEVLWQVEIDRDAVSVLERHYPTVRRYRDVREVSGAELPAVDVLVGGFPCQDLSVAGRRTGLAGERSELFFEIARIAAESTAPWLLLENVDGLLSNWVTHDPPPSDLQPGQQWETDETSSLGIVLSTLANGGYGWAYRVLDAQYFGVPQRRRRAFIIGCLGDTGARAAEVLFEPESVLRDLASCLASGQGAPGIPEEGAGGGGVAHALTAHGGSHGRIDAESETFVVAAPLTAGGHPNSNMPGRHREDDENLVASCHEAQITSKANHTRVEPGRPSDTLNGDSRLAVAFNWQAGGGGNDDSFRGKSRQYVERAGDYAGALSATRVDAVAFTNRGETVEGAHETLRAASHGALPMVRDSYSVRRLMPVECERLMGWADGWTERRADGSLIPDGPRYRMIGNGVVAPVSAWIGRRLRAVMEVRQP